jgi:hypothetical protein
VAQYRTSPERTLLIREKEVKSHHVEITVSPDGFRTKHPVID